MDLSWTNNLPDEDKKLLDNPDWVWLLEKHYWKSKNVKTEIVLGIYRNFYRLAGSRTLDWHKPNQNPEDVLYFRADDLYEGTYFTATCLPFL